MTEEQVYTPEEIAEKLKMSKLTVMNWLRSGKLKGLKAGRYWRVRASDLNAYLTRMRQEDGAEEQENAPNVLER
jgi:excisionase family DNA binding protein